jgi:hypothetical protein
MSAPFGAQAFLEKHEHIEEFAPHVLERVTQCGAPRIGMSTQPPVELPAQKALYMVPAGQPPPSVIGTHCGTAPQELVEGCMQYCSGAHVASPQGARASDGASLALASDPASFGPASLPARPPALAPAPPPFPPPTTPPEPPLVVSSPVVFLPALELLPAALAPAPPPVPTVFEAPAVPPEPVTSVAPPHALTMTNAKQGT